MRKKQASKLQRTAKKQKNLSQKELKKVSGGQYVADPRRAALNDQAYRSLDKRVDRGS